MTRLGKICCVAAAGVAAVCTSIPFATAQSAHVVPARIFKTPFTRTTDRIIVKLKAGADSTLVPSSVNPRYRAMTPDRAFLLSMSASFPLTPFRVMNRGAHVLTLPRNMSVEEVAQITGRLNRDPTVEYAEPDRRVFPQQALTLNDPDYVRLLTTAGNLTGQWYLWGTGASGTGAGFYGIDIEPAWGNTAMGATTAGSGVTVAVIDTGILAHPDILPGLPAGTMPVNPATGDPNFTSVGFDFISAGVPPSEPNVAFDGDDRDGNATDTGDFVTVAEAGMPPFSTFNCAPQPSDWHGTHTAGLIGAATNNGIGIAGVAGGATILPLRVLGKCGGFVDDTADAIVWAAGLSTSVMDNVSTPPRPAGQPPTTLNPNPAQVINLSLGTFGTCGITEQTAIDDALNVSGTTGGTALAIVVAAGNGGNADVSQFTPAGCQHVISVAATDRNGAITNYTNVGAGVTISAPGGFFPDNPTLAQEQDAIWSLWNPGSDETGGTTAVPFVGDPITDYNWFIGTSEATALVSGVAALMIQANPAIDRTTLISNLQSSARGFPDCSCLTTTCGAGIVDAATAVLNAPGPAGASCTATGQISGTVFLDMNGNGRRDPGEPGLAGAFVTLSTSNLAAIGMGAPVLLDSAQTDSTGTYHFTGAHGPLLSAVVVFPPSGFVMEPGVPGSLGGTPGTVTGPAATPFQLSYVSGFTMPSGGTATGYDFGATAIPPPAPVGGGGGGGGGGGCVVAAGSEFDLLFPLCLLAAGAGILVRRRQLRLQRSRTRLR